jgi:hypothetical protein
MESVHRHGGEVRAFIVAPVQPRERWQPSRPRPLPRTPSSWPKSRARKRGLVGETTTTHPNVEFLGYSALAEVEIRFPEPPTRLDCQRGSLDPELPDHGVVQLLWVIASLEGLREELRIPPRRRASGPPAPGQARTQDQPACFTSAPAGVPRLNTDVIGWRSTKKPFPTTPHGQHGDERIPTKDDYTGPAQLMRICAQQLELIFDGPRRYGRLNGHVRRCRSARRRAADR